MPQDRHKKINVNFSKRMIYTFSCCLLAAGLLVIPGYAAIKKAVSPTSPVVDNSKADAPPKHPVTIRKPAGPPTVATDQLDYHGRPVTANCTTCHATREPNTTLNDPALLKDFHQGLTLNHGNLSCMSCHNPNDYDTLKKADGQAISHTNVMQLCGQCHGPQSRDYANGSHGGMQGYWDLSKGPRTRNNCIDCHSPHTPAFPKFKPVFPPDRSRLNPSSSKATSHAEDASHE
ncbi:hypothetical protein [Poriferisphaera sp. WC338]|uniref:hypothetical protein n=1 Tax=Poriferisphaera sp. WC338 TaxID=3425129 RepID=UPI003D8171EF